MTNDTDNLKIDRPVHGDVQYNRRSSVRQLTAAEFLAEIDRALDTPGVSGLVWEQYTPYFNDGDACEFSINEARVLVGDDDVDNADNLDYGRGLSTYDLYVYSYGTHPDGRINYSDQTKTPRELPGGVSVESLEKLLRSLNTSAWEDVALANFGDHAEVTATKDGFNVEFYEHD